MAASSTNVIYDDVRFKLAFLGKSEGEVSKSSEE